MKALDTQSPPPGAVPTSSASNQVHPADVALRLSEERFRSLVEATSLMVWTTSPEGKVVADSPSWRKFTGQSYEEWQGYGWLDAVHPDDRPGAEQAWTEAVAKRCNYEVEYRVRRHDGVYRDTVARAVPVLNDDGTIREWVGCNVDITDQKTAARVLREQNEVVETLNRLGITVNAELELERLVQAVTDAATELIGAQFGAFFYNVLDDKGASYMLHTISGVPKEHFTRFPMPRATALFAPTFNGEGVIRSDDVTKDPRYGKNAPHYGMPKGHLPVKSYLAVPVTSRSGKVLGGLFFGHAQPGVFTERAEKLVVGLAAQAAVALDNAGLFRELEGARRDADAERARVTEAFLNAPVAVAVTRGPEHRFELVNPPYVQLAGRDPTGRTVREAFPEVLTHLFDLLDTVYRTGEPFVGREVETPLNRGQRIETGYFNFVYQPNKRHDGTVDGIIIVANDVTDQVVARKRVEELLEAQRRDKELLAQHARQLALSAAVNAAVAQNDDLDVMLQLCADALQEHVGGALTAIFTYEETDRALELHARAGRTAPDPSHALVSLDHPVLGRVVAERKPRLTQALQDEAQGDLAWARREGLIACAAHPLVSGSRAVGAVALFARAPVPEDILKTLGSVTDAISSGISRKRAEEERRRAEEALRVQTALLKTITDNATLGLVMMDARQHCTFMNPAAEKIFGLTLDEVRARNAPLHDIIHHTHPDGRPFPIDECPIDRALPTRNQESGEDMFVRPDGSFYPVSFTASPLLENGRPVGTVIEVRDITEQKRAELEREKLIRDLERSNRELDQFAYVASHDLKAPLRGIASLSAWLEEDLEHALSADNREKMQLLRGRVHRMEALIDGILDYSRAGRVRHKPERIEVNRLLDEVVELLSPKEGAKVEIPPELPVLYAERTPLQQVFMNLIGNALKHANKDDVQVKVACQDDGAFYRFSVRDNGQGIAPEFHERIWGIFQTLEARDKVEGTGIGLSVVRKIVESRGGRTWVESEPGNGATFLFTWPKAEPSPSEP